MNKKTYKPVRTEKRQEKVRRVLEKRQPDLTVVLENINDPHNLSACLRSCDATGIYEVFFIYHGSQPFPKLGEKSSASAKKWVKWAKYGSVEDCFKELRKQGKKIYTTHMARDAVSLFDLDMTEPCALVFGNEHDGVSEKALELADANFLIPQAGMIQSLNISAACAVSVYEAYRQRMKAGMYDTPRFSPEKLQELYQKWIVI